MESERVYIVGEGFVIEVVGIKGGELEVLYGLSGERWGVTGVEGGTDIFETFACKRAGGWLPFRNRDLFDAVDAPLPRRTLLYFGLSR